MTVFQDSVISLAEVLASIAENVPNSEELDVDINAGLRAFRRGSKPWLDYTFWAGKLKSVLRESEAAAQLDMHLHNAVGSSPGWLDWHETGLPKWSEMARSEGHRILVSRWRFREKFLEISRPVIEAQVAPTIDQIALAKDELPGDSQRLGEIGFIQWEIVHFLDGVGIPHSLERRRTSDPADFDQEAPATESQAPVLHEPVWIDDVGHDEDPVAQKIRAAIREVGKTDPDLMNASPDDARLVNEAWLVFRAWAREAQNELTAPKAPLVSARHFPLAGWTSKEVLFDPPLGKTPMHKDSFRKRISPKARGIKATPTD
jgi:hypothetical protein